jgi:hypothetical protein
MDAQGAGIGGRRDLLDRRDDSFESPTPFEKTFKRNDLPAGVERHERSGLEALMRG